MNGKPVTDVSWHSQDEAFYEITTGIQKVVGEIRFDKQILIQKYLNHKDALEEISQMGIDFCPECGSTEIGGDSITDYDHDEIYSFKECKKCGHFWEV